MREPSAELDSYFDHDGIHPNLRGARYIAKAIAGEIALQAHGGVPERMAADQH
jgi:lysophospholipase L1-like esterase